MGGILKWMVYNGKAYLRGWFAAPPIETYLWDDDPQWHMVDILGMGWNQKSVLGGLVAWFCWVVLRLVRTMYEPFVYRFLGIPKGPIDTFSISKRIRKLENLFLGCVCLVLRKVHDFMFAVHVMESQINSCHCVFVSRKCPVITHRNIRELTSPDIRFTEHPVQSIFIYLIGMKHDG